MKQETSFTTGPWKISKHKLNERSVYTEVGDLICACTRGQKEWKANASLIAAAPDQNAALKKGLYHSETLRMLLTIPDPDLDRDIQEMKDALNKANP